MDNAQPTSGEDWWATAITSITPGEILIRGYPIQELIGTVPFPAVLFLSVTGELPSGGQAHLLEAALVSAIDHGPQAPSIAAARMAATCGADYNSIVGAAVSLLGDVHGGAGQQFMELLDAIVATSEEGDIAAIAAAVTDAALTRGPVPGFGHRYHPVDPRAVRLRAMVAEAAESEVVSGRYLAAASEVERRLEAVRGRPIPMNIDGATAVVYAELGLAPPLGRALFILSRSVGIIAHAWEEMQSGSRLKGPMPVTVNPRYTGPALRHLR